MAFSNGQNVQAADLNNFSVTTVTTTGAVSVGTTLGVTGATNLSSTLGVTGATTVAALTASGTVTPQGLIDASGASAGQLKFPATQNASTNANTLDDYEEGTWTPTIGGDGGQSGQVYSIQVGWYVKIGRQVTAGFRVQLSTLGTITSNAQIKGLPFTLANVTDQSASCALGRWFNLTNSFASVTASANPNTTAIYLWASAAGGAASQASLVQADLSATTYFEGTITYLATA